MDKRELKVEALVAELGSELRRQIAEALRMKELPAGRLLRRPAPDQWNALEVFEHMNLSSGIYLRGLEKAFREQAASLRPAPVFRPGRIGDFSTRAMTPQPDGRIRWRMRTMRMFDPGRRHGADSGSIDRFIALCEGFLRLLEHAPRTDLNRMRITSSLGPIIRFKAGDAFRFPIAHQQRHFAQLERLLAD